MSALHDQSDLTGAFTFIENRLVFAPLPAGTPTPQVAARGSFAPPTPARTQGACRGETQRHLPQHVGFTRSVVTHNPFSLPCWPITHFPSKSDAARVYICTDESLVYEQFFADFGPLNLACIVTFGRQLAAVLDDAQHAGKLVVYYCGSHPHRVANSAVLITCFALVHLGRNVVEA